MVLVNLDFPFSYSQLAAFRKCPDPQESCARLTPGVVRVASSAG